MESASEPLLQDPEPGPLAGHSPLPGLVAVAAAAVLWAVSASVAGSLFADGVEPLHLTEARSLITLVGLVLLRPWRLPAKGRLGPRWLLALGLAIGLVNAAYYIAIDRLAVAVAIVIQYMAPAVVVVGAAVQRRTAPSPDVLVALIVALTGVALVAGVGAGELADTDAIGVAAALASAVLFGSYTLISERAGAVYGAVGTMFRAFAVSTGFWILFQVFRGWPAELVAPENLPRVVFVGIAGTLVPFLLYLWGIGRVRAERAVIAATLEPPAAAIVAWVWLGQTLTVSQLFGGAMVLVAIISLQLSARRAVAAPS